MSGTHSGIELGRQTTGVGPARDGRQAGRSSPAAACQLSGVAPIVGAFSRGPGGSEPSAHWTPSRALGVRALRVAEIPAPEQVFEAGRARARLEEQGEVEPGDD